MIMIPDRPTEIAALQDSGGIDWSAAPGRHWLGVQMWDQLAHVRDANGRVAQESVPAEIIAAEPVWRIRAGGA
jgi:hypothetical protein